MLSFHAVVSLLLAGLTLVMGQGPIDLDLTHTPVQRERMNQRLSGSVSVIRKEGQTAPAAPWKVTLLAVNATQYRPGDTIIFDIEIENMLKESVVIPWSDDRELVDPDDQHVAAGFRNAVMGIKVGSGLDFIVTTIYGSDLVPTSLKSFQPGEKVRIRASSIFRYRPATFDQEVRAPVTMDIQGMYALRELPTGGRADGVYAQVLSGNSLKIEILP